mmetsp:Transcript_3981/g.11096  ORF Transcript_3981/g.11096 Transcript_3981/m.11096 type:complete len:253 (+) Transcript_3981:596-1354(+)
MPHKCAQAECGVHRFNMREFGKVVQVRLIVCSLQLTIRLLVVLLRQSADLHSLPHVALDTVLLSKPPERLLHIDPQHGRQRPGKKLTAFQRRPHCHQERAREVSLGEPGLLVATIAELTHGGVHELVHQRLRLHRARIVLLSLIVLKLVRRLHELLCHLLDHVIEGPRGLQVCHRQQGFRHCLCDGLLPINWIEDRAPLPPHYVTLARFAHRPHNRRDATEYPRHILVQRCCGSSEQACRGKRLRERRRLSS